MHLIITEKHNTARRIAAILSDGKTKRRRIGGVDTYEWDDTRIIGLSGHVMGVDFPKKYTNWSDTIPRELASAEVVNIPTNKKIVSALRKAGKDASKITIATDYDREGELIGVEALNIIKEVASKASVDRAKYSAITPQEIRLAFSNPTPVDFYLASAGESRQVIDLIWGAALTREISITAGRLGDHFLSVGRVQSPTLRIIVDREKEIEAFKPTPYWELYAYLTDGEDFVAKHERGRFLDENEVDEIMGRLGDRGTITQVNRGEKVDRPPAPFNTTEFIRAANAIGYSAANAMRIAEDLYVNGFISYPRTDNTVYPKTLNIREIMKSLINTEFREYAEALLKKKELRATRGKKETTDHPPIHPASPARREDMPETHWPIYELVVRRFFATFADPAIWETLRVIVDISGENFKANGARLLEVGWRWHYPYFSSKELILPPLEEGMNVKVSKIEKAAKETAPPKRYGHGRLIKKMEDLGLGTKSTRHEIINKLYARRYVHDNPLKPTKTAYAVIEALENYAPSITKPEMTSQLERDMDRIAEGEVPMESVVDESREMLDCVFEELERGKEHISESLRSGLREDKIVGPCPTCGQELIVKRSRRGGRFIGCTGYPDCSHSLPLPRNGLLLVTDRACEKHGLNHVRIINKGRRPWDLGCPQCNYDEWQRTRKEKPLQKDKGLINIQGIGEKSVEKLAKAGIDSIEALAKANPEKTAAKINGISAAKIAKWKKAAKEALKAQG